MSRPDLFITNFFNYSQMVGCDFFFLSSHTYFYFYTTTSLGQYDNILCIRYKKKSTDWERFCFFFLINVITLESQFYLLQKSDFTL